MTKEKHLINEEIEKTQKETQNVEKQLNAAKERQLETRQLHQDLAAQNAQAQKILEQSQDDVRGMKNAAQMEIKHESEKLKLLILQHVSKKAEDGHK